SDLEFVNVGCIDLPQIDVLATARVTPVSRPLDRGWGNARSLRAAGYPGLRGSGGPYRQPAEESRNSGRYDNVPPESVHKLVIFLCEGHRVLLSHLSGQLPAFLLSVPHSLDQPLVRVGRMPAEIRQLDFLAVLHSRFMSANARARPV